MKSTSARDFQFGSTRALKTRHHAAVAQPPDWPVFILDGSDVIVVDGEVEVEPFMADEPVELLDASARPVRVVSEGTFRKWWIFGIDDRKTVALEVVDAAPRVDRLRSALTAYLTTAGVTVPVAEEISAFARAAASLIR